ncbi:MAG TPA: hypothetical protein VL147_18180 [Devosia sp.]|nr:hypothetical protein [Devosia sp.]
MAGQAKIAVLAELLDVFIGLVTVGLQHRLERTRRNGIGANALFHNLFDHGLGICALQISPLHPTLPFVFYTGNVLPEDMQQMWPDAPVIAKPAEQSVLVDVIATLLRN